MAQRPVIRLLVPALLAGVLVPTIVGPSAGAASTRTSGRGSSVSLGWTEYDPDDLLGLPGNVHIGYLYGEVGPYGSYVYGGVTDFDCDEGETPWGGGHGAVVEEVVDEGGDVVADAVDDAIDGIVDSGAASVDAVVVVETVGDALADDLGEVAEDAVDEFPACDYVQDRFIDGTDTATIAVNTRSLTARITGTVTVHGGHGEHGEPGTVLGTPPVDITITGGQWENFEYSYAYSGPGYRYSNSQKGTNWYGGIVTGRIGPMGLADDADDEAYGGFGEYSYRTVEFVR